MFLDVEAASGSYFWQNVSVKTQDMLYYGNDSTRLYDGDGKFVYPYDTSVLRVKIPMANWSYPTTVSGDYLTLIFASPSTHVNYLFESGFWNVTVLSADVICGTERIPLELNETSTSMVFDMTEYSASGNSYNIHDMFYIEYTYFFQLVSDANSDGSFEILPDLKFNIESNFAFVQAAAFDDVKSAYSAINENNYLQQEGNQLHIQGNLLQQENNNLQKEENETSKGILSKITDFFGSFFDNLVNSVIGVFVPSTEEISSLFNRLNQFFSDTFGFLYYPFDFIIQAFDVFLNSDSSTGLTLPGFSIMGYEVWGDQTYDLASDPVAGSIFSYVRIGTGAILSMFFVGYLRAFFEKRFGGGGS